MRASFAGCCWPHAASGHAAAPPSRVMNSRRLTSSIGLAPALALQVYRTLKLPHRGRQVLGADLNHSESRRGSGGSRSCAAASNDSTPRCGGRSLHCGISIRPCRAQRKGLTLRIDLGLQFGDALTLPHMLR